MMEKRPDFMGTWTTPLGESYRFYLFEKEKIILDGLGLATVSDLIITDTKVSFTKEYDHSRIINVSTQRAIRYPIKYEGGAIQGHTNFT